MSDIPTTCDDCGLCCMAMTTPPFTPEELKQLEPELKEQVITHRRSVRAWGGGKKTPCMWLDLLTGKCKHYEDRPSLCRNAKIGDPFCLEAREGVIWPK